MLNLPALIDFLLARGNLKAAAVLAARLEQ